MRGTFPLTPGAATTISGSFEWSFTDEDDGDSCATGTVTFTATGPATAPAPTPPAPAAPAAPGTAPRDYTPSAQAWLAVWRAAAAVTRVHTIAVSPPAPAPISIEAAVVKVGPKIPVVAATPPFAEVGGSWVIRPESAGSSVVPPGAQVFVHSPTLLGYTSAGATARTGTAPLLAGRARAVARRAARILRPR